MDKKLTLLLGLSGLAILSLLYGILTPSKTRREVPSSLHRVSKEEGTAIDHRGPIAREAKKSSFGTWGRNPFSLSDRGGAPILNGIAWDEKAPRAVVSNRIVRVGDEVAGHRVVRIQPDRVVLSLQGECVVLAP